MSKKHVHKYHHVELTFGKVWACALPDCNHHMPQHYEQTLPGKRSICWKCDESFILNSSNMELSKPICEKCKLGINLNPDDETDDMPLSSALLDRISKLTNP